MNLRALILLTLAALAPSAAAAQEAPPPVVKAVVYPDRALVTRAVSAPCGPTPGIAHFKGLPPGIDPTTLRANARGPEARVEGVSLYDRVLLEAHSEQVRKLDEQLEVLGVRLRDENTQRNRAIAARSQAESLRQSTVNFLNREAAAEKKPNLAAWATAFDTVRSVIEDADKRRRAADTAMRELNRTIEQVRRKRAALQGGGPARATDAEVLVRCGSAGTARVELSYMAGGVSWQPVYEARADEAKGLIDLSAIGEVVQATGEEWKDVEIVLSTAVTRRDAKPPTPKRLYLGANLEEEKKKVLVRRDEEVRHLESLKPGGAPAGGEGGQVQAVDQGLSVQLTVPGKADFAGDGRPSRLLIETFQLPATFSYVTVPKLVPYVFRKGEAIHNGRFPLLPGRIDLFSGGGYTGSTALERTAVGDKLELAFGIEEPLKVRRVVLDEQSKDPGFLGSTRRLLYSYRVELATFARKPVTIRLQEHVPVSQMDDVKVLFEEKTTPGYQLAKDDGIVTWNVELKPGEKKNVELHFAVEIPSKYDSSAL